MWTRPWSTGLFRWRYLVVAVLASALGCGGDLAPEPALVAISPSQVTNLAPTEAAITGTQLYDAIAVDLDSERSQLDNRWRVSIGGEAMAEDAVVRMDAQTLSVMIPAGLPEGSQDVVVTSPRGRVMTLEGALEITSEPIGLTLHIEGAPGGEGNGVAGVTMAAGESLALFAVVRDAAGVFRSSDVPVDWRIDGPVGTLTSARGAETELLAQGTGSVTVTAEHPETGAAMTGAITIVAGPATVLSVEDAAGGVGSRIGERELTTDDSLTLHAIGRDQYGNFVADVEASWAQTVAVGELSPQGGSSTELVLSTPGSAEVVAMHELGEARTGQLSVVPGRAAALDISPKSADLRAGDAPLDFSLSATDADGNPTTDLGMIAWSVSEGPIGALDPALGVLTPETTGIGRVRAESSHGVHADSGEIRISPGPAAALSIELAGFSLVAGDAPITLAVSGTDAHGNATTDLGELSWSIESGPIGALTTEGVLTPQLAGSGTVRVESSHGASAVSETLTIASGPAVALSVSPDGDTLSADDAPLQLDVSGTDVFGNATSDLGTLSFRVDSGTLATLDSDRGVIDPTLVGSGTVRVDSSHGAFDLTGTFTITPGRAAQLTVAPDTLLLSADDPPAAFTVTAVDGDGNDTTDLGTITWSIASGPIGSIGSGSGLLDPTVAGQGTVRAASSHGASDDSGDVTITPGQAAQLTVAPDTLTTTPADGTTDFTVTATDADGNATADVGTITWSTLGPITAIDPASGVFTPTTAGSGAVRALSSLGPSDDSGTVTVNFGPATTIAIVPDTLTLSADDAPYAFGVSATDAGGNPTTDVGTLTWSTTGAISAIGSESGQLDPTAAGSGAVRVVSSYGPTDDSGTVTIEPGQAAVLTVAPDTLTTDADATVTTFTVSAVDGDGNATSDVGTITWSTTGPITAIGSSTGDLDPTAAGSGTVRAESSHGPVDESGTVTIDPGEAAALKVTPDDLTLNADDAPYAFGVTGTDADGNVTTDLGTLTWGIASGTITEIGTSTGVLDPTMAGSGTVEVSSAYGPSDVTDGTITIDPGQAVSLTVAPETLVTRVGDPATSFSASGVDGDGNATTDVGALMWSTTGSIAAIDSLTGDLTPSTEGVGTVRVDSSYSIFDVSGSVTIDPEQPEVTVVAIAAPPSVVRGQRNVRVDVDVHNGSGSLSAFLTSVALSFQLGGGPVTSDYTVVADYRNATLLGPAATETLTFYVDVSATAATGTIDLGAALEAFVTGYGTLLDVDATQWMVAAGAPPVAVVSKPDRPDNRVCQGGTVDFEGKNSTGTGLTYDWSFTSGTPPSSSLEDPLGITYNTLGSHPYSLTVTDALNLQDTAIPVELVHVGTVATQPEDTYPTGTVWFSKPGEGDNVKITDLPSASRITMAGGSDKDLEQCNGAEVNVTGDRYVTVWVDRGVIDPLEDDRPAIPGIQVNLDSGGGHFNELNLLNASPALEGEATVYGEYFHAGFDVVTAAGHRGFNVTDDNEAPGVEASLPEANCAPNCWGKAQPFVFRFSEPMDAASVLANTRVHRGDTDESCADADWTSLLGGSTLSYDEDARALHVWPDVRSGSYPLRVRVLASATDTSSNANTLPLFTRCVDVYNAAAEPVPADPVVQSLGPNPFSPDGDGSEDTVDFQLDIDAATRRLEVRITRGPSEVRTLLEIVTGPSTEVVTWDGRDNTGRMVPDGYYRYRITAYNADGVASGEVEGVVQVDSAVHFTGVPPRY